MDSSNQLHHEVFNFYLPFVASVELFILCGTLIFTYQFFKKLYSALRVFYILQAGKMLLFAVSYYVALETANSNLSENSVTNALVWQTNQVVFFASIQIGLLLYFIFSSQVKNTLTR